MLGASDIWGMPVNWLALRFTVFWVVLKIFSNSLENLSEIYLKLIIILNIIDIETDYHY